jgi:hypothetical protein
VYLVGLHVYKQGTFVAGLLAMAQFAVLLYNDWYDSPLCGTWSSYEGGTLCIIPLSYSIVIPSHSQCCLA